MKLSITVIVLLALTFSGYAATRPSASRAEAAARRVCLDRAQASGHRVQGVRSVDRKGRNNFRVTLRVEGGRATTTNDRAELNCTGNGPLYQQRFHARLSH